MRTIDRLVESNREQRRKRIEREEREDKLLISRNSGTYREEYNEYVKKTPITYEDYVRVKNRKITFVPKKHNKSTLERIDFHNKETGDFMARIVMNVGTHKNPRKQETYFYGKIQFDVDTELINKTALIQVYIPKEGLDPPEIPDSITGNFLKQDGNEWTKLIESEEDRNSRIKKDVQAKIKQVQKSQKRG